LVVVFVVVVVEVKFVPSGGVGGRLTVVAVIVVVLVGVPGHWPLGVTDAMVEREALSFNALSERKNIEEMI